MVDGRMPDLPDPKSDRQVKEVSPPPHHPLSQDFLYNKSTKYLLNMIIHFYT